MWGADPNFVETALEPLGPPSTGSVHASRTAVRRRSTNVQFQDNTDTITDNFFLIIPPSNKKYIDR